MANLLKHKAKICYTAAGVLIRGDKALLIKHKKLGIWFCPGGHIDENELPHAAAEREFWEETGIKVKAIDPHYTQDSTETEYLPSPIETNLHWVSEKNYNRRIKSKNPKKRVDSKLWSRGCEQHVGFVYMVEPVDDSENGLKFKQNIEETDGIGWFSYEEMVDLPTTDDIRHEIKHSAELARKYKNLKK